MCSCTKALLAAALLGLSACATPGTPQPEPAAPSTSVTASAQAPSESVTQQPEPAPSPSLQDSFTAMRQQLPAGPVGMVISDGTTETAFGDWSTGPAWSTIKVPLSIAALRHSADSAIDMRAAITLSDNAAADRLWAMLGSPEQAAAAVQQVLRDGGDEDTAVQAQQVRPPYSAYGQTQWSAARAARFAVELPCVPGAQGVLTEMRNLGGGQRWGLATQPGVAAKGGWGPGPGGGYLVRQLALVSEESGSVGVALAAEPDDGQFATATAMLNELGQWFVEHRHNFSTVTCHTA